MNVRGEWLKEVNKWPVTKKDIANMTVGQFHRYMTALGAELAYKMYLKSKESYENEVEK